MPRTKGKGCVRNVTCRAKSDESGGFSRILLLLFLLLLLLLSARGEEEEEKKKKEREKTKSETLYNICISYILLVWF